MTKIGTLAAGLLIATTAAASAHTRHSGIEARQERQTAAIEEGRQDGSITWTEGLKLRKEQREITRAADAFMSDGRLTANERRILRHMQDEAGTHIVAEASDGWHRVWWMPRFGK